MRRYDKRAGIHEAFLSLGCTLICWQSLRNRWMPSGFLVYCRQRTQRTANCR